MFRALRWTSLAAPPPSFSPSHQNSLPLSPLCLRLTRTVAFPLRRRTVAFPLRRRLSAPPLIPDSSVFAKLLNFCIDKKSVRNSWKVHARIINSQFYDEVFILNRLIDMYSKCRCLDDARQVFDKMPERNTFSWNAMITGYAKMGDIEHALQLFHDMPSPDEVSWNAIISGFSIQNHWYKALQFFAKMHSEGFGVNLFSVSSALSSCAGLGALDIGLQIHDREGAQLHALVIKSNFEDDMVLGNALVDMYAKCNIHGDARQVFDRMPLRDVVSAKLVTFVRHTRSMYSFHL